MANLNLQPTLVGDTITLRPLAASDFEALYQAAADPKIWAQHPDTRRYRRDVFEERFFRPGLECAGTLVVVANESGDLIGSSRFYEWEPEQREISVGYTFLARSHWGGPTNAEMKRLMLTHAATAADWAWFHIGEANLRSRRAVEKLGAELVRSENRELEGRPFVQLYYRLPLSGWRSK